MIKNVSQFKKELKIGRKLHATFHLKVAGRTPEGVITYQDEDKSIREVSIIQTNSFALKTIKSDGTKTDSWCSYPKASEFQPNEDGSISILEENREKEMIPVLTYKFID